MKFWPETDDYKLGALVTTCLAVVVSLLIVWGILHNKRDWDTRQLAIHNGYCETTIPGHGFPVFQKCK